MKYMNQTFSKKKKISLTLKIFLLVILTIIFNPDFRSIKIPIINISLLTTTQLIFILYLFCYSFFKVKIKINHPYFKWCIISIIFYFLSLLWTLNKDNAIQTLESIILMLSILLFLSYFIENIQNIDEILKVLLIAIILTMIYIITTVNISEMNEGVRLGATVSGMESWNANQIGMMMSIGISLCIYFLDNTKKLYKIMLLILSLIFFIIILISGSRKAIIMMLMITILFLYIKTKGIKKLWIIILSAFTIIFLFILIMNYEPLYLVIGVRIENVFKSILGIEFEEESINVRGDMIYFGLNCFLKKPIIGYGLISYEVLWGIQTGIETYSHNNYVEILVNGGIIGFIIHYYSYIYIIKNLWEQSFQRKEKIAILLLVINSVYLMMQWFFVSYSDEIVNLFIMLSMAYCIIQKKNLNNMRLMRNEDFICKL